MPDTHTYHITRSCLKSGRMFLSPSARAFFPKEGRVQATDAHSGETLELTLLDALTVSPDWDPFINVTRSSPTTCS